MITEALQHCSGIGPVRLAQLRNEGVKSWNDVLASPERIPSPWRSELIAECQRCQAALDAEDARYFVDRFAPADKWRILDYFFDQTTFFDIETMGLQYDASITVIVCWHDGQFRIFVEHENLDDFLELLDDAKLLASFNGASFDVPRVLNSFHIPTLPCAHLDLRWSCYHQGHSGGLKDITRRMGIERPEDLHDADGELAVQLWQAWKDHGDNASREQLIRYCAADVLLLVMLAHQLAGRCDESLDDLWASLPAASSSPSHNSPASYRKRTGTPKFGNGSPTQLRAWRRLFAG